MTAQVSRAKHLGTLVAEHGVLICVSVIFGYPVLWMVFGALKDPSHFYDHIWGPDSHIHLANFSNAWSLGDLGRYYINSIFVTACAIVLSLILVYPLAHAIARLRFPGSGAILGLFAVCLFIPFALTIIPLFDLVYRMHIFDTYAALILPAVSGSMPFAVVFATAYLRSIPKELEEAAALDGAGQWRTMFRIVVPLSRPAFATIVVYTFLSVWNEFLVPLTLAQSNSVRTLPVGLLSFRQVTGTVEYPLLFAALTVSALPVIAVFLLCQRQFLSGLMAGAVKL